MDNLLLRRAGALAGLLPLVWMAGLAASHSLGANPIEAVLNKLGFWAIFFLCASLLPTTVKIVSGNKRLLQLRRTFGLTSFLYAVLHFLTYVVLDQGLDWDEILKDVEKRIFIMVGLAALVLLVPLAVTSTGGWVARLGARNWQRLHTLVYPAALLAAFHFLLRVKADYLEPGIFSVAILVMLFTRLVAATRKS